MSPYFMLPSDGGPALERAHKLKSTPRKQSNKFKKGWNPIAYDEDSCDYEADNSSSDSDCPAPTGTPIRRHQRHKHKQKQTWKTVMMNKKDQYDLDVLELKMVVRKYGAPSPNRFRAGVNEEEGMPAAGRKTMAMIAAMSAGVNIPCEPKWAFAAKEKGTPGSKSKTASGSKKALAPKDGNVRLTSYKTIRYDFGIGPTSNSLGQGEIGNIQYAQSDGGSEYNPDGKVKKTAGKKKAPAAKRYIVKKKNRIAETHIVKGTPTNKKALTTGVTPITKVLKGTRISIKSPLKTFGKSKAPQKQKGSPPPDDSDSDDECSDGEKGKKANFNWKKKAKDLPPTGPKGDPNSSNPHRGQVICPAPGCGRFLAYRYNLPRHWETTGHEGVLEYAPKLPKGLPCLAYKCVLVFAHAEQLLEHYVTAHKDGTQPCDGGEETEGTATPTGLGPKKTTRPTPKSIVRQTQKNNVRPTPKKSAHPTPKKTVRVSPKKSIHPSPKKSPKKITRPSPAKGPKITALRTPPSPYQDSSPLSSLPTAISTPNRKRSFEQFVNDKLGAVTPAGVDTPVEILTPLMSSPASGTRAATAAAAIAAAAAAKFAASPAKGTRLATRIEAAMSPLRKVTAATGAAMSPLRKVTTATGTTSFAKATSAITAKGSPKIKAPTATPNVAAKVTMGPRKPVQQGPRTAPGIQPGRASIYTPFQLHPSQSGPGVKPNKPGSNSLRFVPPSGPNWPKAPADGERAHKRQKSNLNPNQ